MNSNKHILKSVHLLFYTAFFASISSAMDLPIFERSHERERDSLITNEKDKAHSLSAIVEGIVCPSEIWKLDSKNISLAFISITLENETTYENQSKSKILGDRIANFIAMELLQQETIEDRNELALKILDVAAELKTSEKIQSYVLKGILRSRLASSLNADFKHKYNSIKFGRTISVSSEYPGNEGNYEGAVKLDIIPSYASGTVRQFSNMKIYNIIIITKPAAEKDFWKYDINEFAYLFYNNNELKHDFMLYERWLKENLACGPKLWKLCEGLQNIDDKIKLLSKLWGIDENIAKNLYYMKPSLAGHAGEIKIVAREEPLLLPPIAEARKARFAKSKKNHRTKGTKKSPWTS